MVARDIVETVFGSRDRHAFARRNLFDVCVQGRRERGGPRRVHPREECQRGLHTARCGGHDLHYPDLLTRRERFRLRSRDGQRCEAAGAEGEKQQWQ